MDSKIVQNATPNNKPNEHKWKHQRLHNENKMDSKIVQNATPNNKTNEHKLKHQIPWNKYRQYMTQKQGKQQEILHTNKIQTVHSKQQTTRKTNIPVMFSEGLGQ